VKITYALKPNSDRRKNPFIPKTLLPFGQLRTDHMFLMDYINSTWVNPRIVPYGNLSIAPGAIALHYGQEIFEGIKAFKHADGEIYVFRVDKNAKRLNMSSRIMNMPEIPVADQIEAIDALIDVDRLWYPDQERSSFYIRPFMFATQDSLAVQASRTYTFCIFLSPSGPYYQMIKPLKILITKKYHRAIPGGSGNAKAGGNYGVSLRPLEFAKTFGASQVLYLDHTNTYVEEVGTMNHFHIRRDKIFVIPKFTDTILRSITSESILELKDYLNVEVRQEMVRIDQFINEIKDKAIIEAGGLGTAAVITPIGSYVLDDGNELIVGDGKPGNITYEVLELFTKIQVGETEAPQGWLHKVKRTRC
jgi:branched-chain amino acid aminotransferase